MTIGIKETILKRIGEALKAHRLRQMFSGLPGLLADSLPDAFGNSLIKRYMESERIDLRQITPLDRLAYVGSRGMGALTFKPAIKDEAERFGIGTAKRALWEVREAVLAV